VLRNLVAIKKFILNVSDKINVGPEKMIEYDSETYFNEMIGVISTKFSPNLIHDEIDFQSQLIEFLESEFPKSTIEQDFQIKNGRIDIIVDKKYVFELTIPEYVGTLKNLEGRIEEFREEFQYICIIIFKDESSSLAISISEFSKKIQIMHNITSLVFTGTKMSG
jgi:hypothetical protein